MRNDRGTDGGPRAADALRASVLAKYAAVARDPEGQFPYPVGRAGLEALGYRPEWIAALPPRALSRFAGIGNPLGVLAPAPGDRVLDAGCGAGADAAVAASLVGRRGRVVGADLSAAMLPPPGARASPASPSFVRAAIEALPFRDGAFDFVLSNGALNLVTAKRDAWAELARVLRPGGRLALADVVLREDLPPEVAADPDAWSN